MPNPLQPAGQYMQQETADELRGVHAHHLLLRVVAVILPAKLYLVPVEVDQTIIGDRHAVRIATEIVQHVSRTAKRRLGVHQPTPLCARAPDTEQMPWLLEVAQARRRSQ